MTSFKDFKEAWKDERNLGEHDLDIKDDKDKPRLSLVPPQRYLDALMRHLVEYMKDHNSVDEESGYKHLWHLATNVAILCELEEEKQ